MVEISAAVHSAGLAPQAFVPRTVLTPLSVMTALVKGRTTIVRRRHARNFISCLNEYLCGGFMIEFCERSLKSAQGVCGWTGQAIPANNANDLGS